MTIIRNLILPVIFILLAYGFWVSLEFEQIAAGVAIFLLGMLELEEGFRAFSGVFESPRTVRSGHPGSDALRLGWVDGLNRSASGSGRPSLRLSVH